MGDTGCLCRGREPLKEERSREQKSSEAEKCPEPRFVKVLQRGNSSPRAGDTGRPLRAGRVAIRPGVMGGSQQIWGHCFLALALYPSRRTRGRNPRPACPSRHLLLEFSWEPHHGHLRVRRAPEVTPPTAQSTEGPTQRRAVSKPRSAKAQGAQPGQGQQSANPARAQASQPAAQRRRWG